MRPVATTAIALTFLLGLSCAKKEEPAAATTTPAAEALAPAAPSGPKVVVRLKSGRTVGGTIVASSATDMTILGNDNVETKIPTDQVASVDYSAGKTPEATKTAVAAPPAPVRSQPPAAPAAPKVTSKTLELPIGAELSVRLNETVDSKTATEGQTYDAEITRDAKDADGDVVIPRLARAAVVIRSASKGNRFVGASDLVVDVASVNVEGKRYTVGTADLKQKGKDGIGANKRTAKFAGAGAAVGAVVGAIAGGGSGAAIGAGVGAGAGVAGQVITKGGAIKIPAETILTFHLDQPLRVTVAAQ